MNAATTKAESFSHRALALCNPIPDAAVPRGGEFIAAASGFSWGGNIATAVRVSLFSLAAVLLAGCSPAYAGHQHLESWYADALAAETGAKTEARMRDGTRCDVLTATHAIEVEFASKWCEAVGQSLNYASQTGKPGGIALILESGSDARFLQRLRALIAWHDLPLVVVVLRPINKDGLQLENLSAVAPAWSLGAPLTTPAIYNPTKAPGGSDGDARRAACTR